MTVNDGSILTPVSSKPPTDLRHELKHTRRASTAQSRSHSPQSKRRDQYAHGKVSLNRSPRSVVDHYRVPRLAACNVFSNFPSIFDCILLLRNFLANHFGLGGQLGFSRAVAAVSRLAAALPINHVAKNMHNTLSFFALDEPDVSVEVGDRGVYRGKVAITTLFQDQFGSATLKGNLLFPFLTTGMIEVAGDGKTAKGTWRSPSVQAVMSDAGPEPIWLFGAYAIDFIKKGDDWKIWHFHWYRTIKCNHHKGWVEDQSTSVTFYEFKRENQTYTPLPSSPDIEPTTYHNPYTPESIQDSIPGCPPPYEHYDGPSWQNTDQAQFPPSTRAIFLQYPTIPAFAVEYQDPPPPNRAPTIELISTILAPRSGLVLRKASVG
ncbi:uncharacterized protein MYCFIDRAFT_175638 [Pseudocercospora fijiensis CIRAD86]|uniref:SnoaL-like domain-containing protein n=1 Tax=Pseudocercospora fijiensis (strain CIRAD86) TaxID=383855 RepID=M3AY47_PSEFD|nr:uncharacterized protein MYCFIDRAFT_175638 [Pseudocercospora fijiensis CIRAD86]EME82083.1 hypothetical protein MYCFIDRAFT_175638 [Pseudocercospora fijiensis CIRAD86]